MKSKRTSVIGVVIPDLGNEFFTSIVSGVEGYLNDLGYSIILCDYNENYELQIRYSKLLLSRNIAGLIIAPSGKCKPFISLYEELGIPVVFIDSFPFDIPDCNCVMIDNASAAYTLCNHMLDMYGVNLLLLSTSEGSKSSKSHHSTSRIRLDAAKQAFADRNLSLQENWIQISEMSTFEGGYQVICDFLSGGNLPKGILATSNNIAYGAIAAIQDRGLTVPHDIGVACFDALDTTRLVRPRITSITQPTIQIGMLAAQLAYNNLKAKRNFRIPNQKIIVEPNFVIAESCGYYINHTTI